MAEKILMILVAFVAGAALIVLVFAKLLNLGVRASPRVRKMIRDTLDREDAKHAIVGGPKPDSIEDQFNSGVELGYAEEVSRLPWYPHCDRCREPLEAPGALLFSPPNQHGECTKFHLCRDVCYGDVKRAIFKIPAAVDS